MAQLFGKNSRNGQSLIDILIGMVLLVISINAAVVLVFGGQSALTNRENATQGRSLAKEGIEAANLILKESWNGTADGIYGLAFSTTTGKWQWSGSEDSTSIFTRKITVSALNSNEKSVSSTVSWTYNPLKSESVELVTLVTDWAEVQATGGDTGGSGASGDWQHPKTLGSVDLGAGESATDLDVKNKIVYMTAEASDSKKPDFFIIDATNGQNPFIVTSTNTGKGLLGIDVAGNYAYLVGKDDSAELYVFDVSNTNAPRQVASLNLDGSADAFTVFYYNSHLYIGRANGAPQEFVVVDVADPLHPSVVGGLSNVGDEINEIFVKNDRAYLGTEENGRGMIVVNVADPTSPLVFGSFNSGMHVYGIYPESEGKVYTGGKTKFFTVDSSSSTHIFALGSSTIGYKTRDIAFSSPYAFLGTEDSNKEFQIWNVSNPQSPALWSSYNFPQVASGVDYEDNIVYVSVRSNDALRIITSQ